MESTSMECEIVMPDLPLLYSELVRFETELWNAVDARLRADHDLPLARFELMRVVASTENCRVNDLADQLVVTIGGVSKVVDRVEASGYCVRTANPEDRRSSLIALTPAGEKLLAAASATFESELSDRFALPADQLDQLAGILTALRAR